MVFHPGLKPMTHHHVLSLLLLAMLAIPRTSKADPLNPLASGFELPAKSSWVGPHANVHLGHGDPEFSLGLELSHWRTWEQVAGKGTTGEHPMLGVDLGAEYNFSADKWVEYGELQVGFVLAGMSVGPVHDGEHGFGVQASLWMNFFAGTMVRFRRFGPSDQEQDMSVGFYLTLPFHEA
jgi:hypothetical protein